MSPPKPVSLRVSVTDRCQLRCIYCMPPEGIALGPRDEILRFEEIVRFVRVVRRRFGIHKVHITGGEPLLRANVATLVRMLAGEGIDDLALSTNGILLAEMAHDLRKAGLHRVNVSLDSLSREMHADITRRSVLPGVLDGIRAALAAGLAPVRINAVVLRGMNDGEVVRLAEYAIRAGCTIRFLELMPIGVAAERFDELFVPRDEILARLGERFDMRPLPYVAGSSARYWRARTSGQEGTIGIISSVSEPFCAGCRRLRLSSGGSIVSCLARGEGTSVRDLLRDASPAAEERLAVIVATLLDEKAPRRCFTTRNAMASVGG